VAETPPPSANSEVPGCKRNNLGIQQEDQEGRRRLPGWVNRVALTVRR